MPIDALSVLCAQLTRDLLAIAKFLFCLEVSRSTGPPNVNLGHPIISETVRARKFKLKIQLDMVKYLFRV